MKEYMTKFTKFEYLDTTEKNVIENGIYGVGWMTERIREIDKYTAIECMYDGAKIQLKKTLKCGADYEYELDGVRHLVFVR